MTAEKKDYDKSDNEEIVIVSFPSFATVLRALDTLRCYLQNADVASNRITYFNALQKAVVETRPKQRKKKERKKRRKRVALTPF